jgi:hypothetical protein
MTMVYWVTVTTVISDYVSLYRNVLGVLVIDCVFVFPFSRFLPLIHFSSFPLLHSFIFKGSYTCISNVCLQEGEMAAY